MSAPVLSSLSPASAVLGAGGFTLTLNGSGFTSDAVAHWGATTLATTFVSANQLTATVPAGLIAASAATLISVVQISGTSNTLTFLVPNPIDLTTLAAVRFYVGSSDPTKNGDDPLLQDLITGVSQYWLTRTCRGSLNSIATYSERYDGNNKDSLLLRYYPIVSVVSLTVDGMPVPQSPDYIQGGWVINPNTKDEIVIVGGCYSGAQYSFYRGRLNVAITYTAGFSEVPFDIEQAVRKQVAVNFKRKATTDQASVTYPQTGGMTSYRNWAIPPECEQVLQSYRRLTP